MTVEMNYALPIGIKIGTFSLAFGLIGDYTSDFL
jgi:hypothetical protein